ncbi:MAG TPA: hypothetical protein VFS60_10650 [Thermoanaerobaculia bacterium]|nr:hypothetical protein [Thermoanaerobaculia bacterium]
MRFRRRAVVLSILATCLGTALLVSLACVIPGPPVRGAGPVVNASDVANLANEAAYKRVRDGSLEEADGYTLAFLEFDSSGEPGEGQAARAAEAIRKRPDRDAVVVLFVHGWGHSADPRDPHVVEFRRTLAELACKLPDRSVVGIFVSWRAKWLKEPLHFLTYLDRSAVAQRLGGEDCTVREELGKLRAAVEQRGRDGDLAIAIGHSLGGQLLFSYTEECLDTDPDETCCDRSRPECGPQSPPRDLPLFGDLVLLVNPAQDTHDFEVFRKYARTHDGEPPVLVVLSSEADHVIGRTYHWGRTVRNLLWPKYWHRDKFWPETIGLGWDGNYSHVLCSTAGDAVDSSVCSARQLATYSLCCDYGTTTLWSRGDCAGSACLRPGPFVVVRVDGRVVTDHGDMFNAPFAEFVRLFVAGAAKGGEAGVACPSPVRG